MRNSSIITFFSPSLYYYLPPAPPLATALHGSPKTIVVDAPATQDNQVILHLLE